MQDEVSSRSMALPRRPAAFVCLVTAALVAACGGGSGGSPDGNVVNGVARLGWDQPAGDASELGSLHFVLYLDGTRTELTGASCSTTAGAAGFPCTSLLPSMSNGQHTIELASYIAADPILESPKSPPLVITVTGSAITVGSVNTGAQASAASAHEPTPARELITSDGTRLEISVLAQADGPSALAVSEDGAVFIADRAGIVRMVRDGLLVGESAIPGGAAAGGGGTGILDLALDPQFARNHLVYVLAAASGEAPTFSLSRFREVGGRLGERASLFDGVPASPERPSGSLAFGPDARLYVAFDDGGDPNSARRAASYNGKVLRLNTDGTTPGDQPGASPIYASNLQAPRSLAWDASTSSLWVADAGARRVTRIRVTARRAIVVTPYRLPLTDGPSSIAVYRSTLIPALQGNLLVAPAQDATYLLRARLSGPDQNATASTERLGIFDESTAASGSPAGFVRLVRIGPDGAIYVGTDHEVLRIVPR
jgi:glucose/arabinose dehydrogenase